MLIAANKIYNICLVRITQCFKQPTLKSQLKFLIQLPIFLIRKFSIKENYIQFINQ